MSQSNDKSTVTKSVNKRKRSPSTIANNTTSQQVQNMTK